MHHTTTNCTKPLPSSTLEFTQQLLLTTLGMREMEDDKAMRAAFQSHSTAEDVFTVTLAYFNA